MTTTATSLAIVAARTAVPAQALMSPRAASWETFGEVNAALEPTPLDRQPSAYVQKAWAGRARGGVGEVSLRAAASAGTLLLRLQWAAPDPRHGVTDNDVYADACAALFPWDGSDAELTTMGSADQPVVGWQWRAGAEVPFLVEARGLGTVARLPKHQLTAAGEWASGSWVVVLAHPLEAPSLPASGKQGKVAFAVWSGAASERAGLKSFTPAWLGLKVE